MRTRVVNTVGLVGGMLSALCLLNLLLWTLPVQDGLFIGDTNPGWPAFHFVPNMRFTHSDGWDLHGVVHGRTNNLGYVAPFDYAYGEHGVVVVGDSFVESAMNDYSHSLQGQLQLPSLPGEAILNFGYSGASLPDYLGVASLAAEKFKLDWLVVVIVPGDFVEGFGAEPGFFHWAPGHALPVTRVPDRGTKSAAKKIVRNIALVRYVKGHLGVSVKSLLGYSPGKVAARTGCVTPQLEPGDAPLIRDAVRSIPEAAHVPAAHVVLVFDADVHPLHEQQLMGGRSLCPTRDSLARSLFSETAAHEGLHVIDMQPIFARYVESAHEKIDLPDSHWNARGNRLASQAVARVIEAEQAHAGRAAVPQAQ